jgi:two-component system, sensor histidine kinase PdtaS
MATLAELARQHTALNRDDIHHLQNLLGDWGMIADFCFADMLLYLLDRNDEWLIAAQVRPATSQTLYATDWVGSKASAQESAILWRAQSSGILCQGEVTLEGRDESAQVLAIPVRHAERVIGVLTREWSPTIGRQPGELERNYLAISDRFAAMIAAGQFPFPGRPAAINGAPRVGDGVIILDADAEVQFASPNAVSALHRVGITTNVTGARLTELGFNEAPVRQAFEERRPVLDEFDQTSDVTLITHCIPLLEGSGVTGAVMLLRDVSELRRRDRLLLSKDATIREIHHRVKNNLQTISSLLRLQARRLASDEAKAAVNESVRRIRTIALVHETLSREAGDDVAFSEIVRPLLRLAEEGLQSPDRPVRFRVTGDGGSLPAIVATPLSVVLTELMQNAVDHGFPEGSGGGTVVVHLANDGTELHIRVVDDGLGVPHGFSLDQANGLGLVIVRTLVTTELAGAIEMRAATNAELDAAGLGQPARGTGTVVDLRVPVDPDDR